MASELATDLRAGLAEFQQQSEYDAEVIARDIETECAATMPVLETPGRWWRGGGTGLAVVTGIAALATGGAVGVVVGVLGGIGSYLLRRKGNRVDQQRRADFEASRDAARRAMTASVRDKEIRVRRGMERWLRDHVGARARTRAGRDLDALLTALDGLEVVFHVVDERRRDSAETELRRSRQDVRDGFTTAADELRDGCKESIRQVLDEVVSPTLMAIQRERGELRAEQDGRADTAAALVAQLKRCGDTWAATVRYGGGVQE